MKYWKFVVDGPVPEGHRNNDKLLENGLYLLFMMIIEPFPIIKVQQKRYSSNAVSTYM